MYEVSEKFLRLSQDNGRHVFCKIIAGDEVFFDDTITGFEFDDIAHPDWYTLGTTCSNRFHFTAKAECTLDDGDKVRPFISFDGEEWCPLGVFYITRRYIREGYISITAYDLLYFLCDDFVLKASLPTNSAEILREICTQYGISCDDCGYEYRIDSINEKCSVRDMIGYIAALNNTCASIDRNGALVLRGAGYPVFTIDEKNCMDIRHNQDRSVITCLKCKSELQELTSGAGADISTMELYNPLMTQHNLDVLMSLHKPFGFYGADIEMQGLPFLEAGECVDLLHNKWLYRLVISEIEYIYDGGFTAVMHSKNKCAADAVVYQDDLEEKLDELTDKFSVMYLKYYNDGRITVTQNSSAIAGFSFEASSEGFAQTDADITIKSDTDCVVYFRIFVNGTDTGHKICHRLNENSETHINLYHLSEVHKGHNTITITAHTGLGSAEIPAGALFAGVVIHGAGGFNTKDRLNFVDVIQLSVSDSCSFAEIYDNLQEESE